MNWGAGEDNDCRKAEFRMKESDPGQQIEQKTPYSAPKLRVIELATDEVLGTGCKTLSDVVPTAVCGQSACGLQTGS